MRQWNREQQCIVDHQTPNAAILQWIYETRLGRLLGYLVFARRYFGRLNGWYYDQPRSARQIAPFIEKYAVAMDEFEAVEYRSFNEFFVRRFNAGVRNFVDDPALLPAFAEARLLAWPSANGDQQFPVKGQCLDRTALLGDAVTAQQFDGGPVIVARLAPQDYHRFHYVDDGEIISQVIRPGWLHSVSPIALRAQANVWCRNYRHVTVQQTANLGVVAYIDVGAMTIGRIIQRHLVGATVKRGEERGYFMYGGSTVVLLGEPGAWTPDADIIDNTTQHIETIVRLGTAIGSRL